MGADSGRARGGSIRSIGIGLCFATVLAAYLAGVSRAEPPRAGLWISGGSGWIEAKTDCRECEDAHFDPTPGVRLAVGGTPSRAVRLGLELFGMVRDDGGSTTRQVLALLGTRWNPNAVSGFHVRAGYGLAHGRQAFVLGGERILATNTGISWQIGAGWDLPAGPVHLTPSATMLVGAYGTIETDRGVLQDALMTSYWIGLEVMVP